MSTNTSKFVLVFFQAYAALTLSNEDVKFSVYSLEFKAQKREETENLRRNKLYGTYKHPSKTQYAYLVKQPLLYATQWDIMSDQIRERQQAYKESPTADLTTPLPPT